MLKRLDGTGRRVAVIQPSYFPWRGYFHQIWLADTFVFLDDVQYDKHSWRNRNRVKGPNGSFWITVPILLPDWPPPPIHRVGIDNSQSWRRKHWESIRQNYRAAPHAQAYLPLLEDLYAREWKSISELDVEASLLVLRALGLERSWVLSSRLNVPGASTERLLNICREVEATHYLSGPTARDYLDETRFRDVGIQVEWMEYVYPPYPQMYGAFDPHLSIIDLLLNCGSDAGEYVWGRHAVAHREAIHV